MAWKGDPHAFHDDVDGEIAALTEKATPVAADLVVINDSEDSNSVKSAQAGNLPGGNGGGGNGNWTLISTHTVSGSEANITFTGIAATHDYLVVRAFLQTDRASTTDGIDMQLGDGSIDTGSVYSSASTWGGGSTGNDEGTSNDHMTCKVCAAAASSGADDLGFYYADIEAYADDTRHTRVDVRAGVAQSSDCRTSSMTGVYAQKNTVDQVRLTPEFGSNFTAGYVELWGVSS